ncbi:MAG: thioredoxin domain-containing protein [Bacteroidetes bacterium]|jgi:protein-disulfide isomerase|nr:thioredoxin domain-containing protein [Bacteroidota bacterium]
MNNKTVQIALLIIFLIVSGAALFYGLAGSDSVEEGDDRTPQQVTILEYFDYSCPACRDYSALVNQLKKDYGDMIEVKYRHFPLSGFQHSRMAAHSVEAAGEQGKFQEMHDIVFENQPEWSRSNEAVELIEGYAEQLELDMEQFRTDRDSEEIAERVEKDRQEGIRRTVNSTPTFFINGRKLQQNPQSYEQFKSIVELQMYRSN